MHSPALRYIRYIIAVFSLLTIGFLFVDYRNLTPPDLFKAFTWLQFGPSLVQFIHYTGILSAGFIFILILTLLVGRFYCSALCPLGILQDIMLRIEKWFLKRKVLRFRKATWWRYVFLGLAAISLLTGFMAVFNLLDPYSNFGRIFSSLAKPVIILANNLAAKLLGESGPVIINQYPIRGFDVPTIVYPLLIVALLLYLTWRHGRLFCNLICPVGTLLGLISRFSIFKISLDKSVCNQCGKCSAKCKANCIDIKTQEIDYSRCVMCFDCIGPCPDDGVKLGRVPVKNYIADNIAPADPKQASRRKFIGSAFLLGLAGHLFAQKKDTTVFEKPTTIPEKKSGAVSPPGSRSVEEFTSKCIACHLCVSACPTQVLQPSMLQYGLQGFLMPHMDYHANFCNFECVACGKACPTGAIEEITVEEKKTIQLGKTTFVKENCVVYTYNTACGACSEHCPTKAVHMVPYLNGLKIPEVNQSICVGCGACEYACPTKPYKAIFVNGNAVHQVAEAPKEEKIERDVENEEWAF